MLAFLHWARAVIALPAMTTWDENKRATNLQKHGVDLALAGQFDFVTAEIDEDTSEEYGERRERAVGAIGDKLYVYVYTLDDNDEDHAISLRRATPKERRKYEQA